jgi:hypothetical protein
MSAAGARFGAPALGCKRVQFLLVLSAMLAGLTGFMSGDRAVEPRQVEQAVAAAAAVAQIAPAATEAAAAAPAAAIPVALRKAWSPASFAAPRGLAPVDERRLE